MEKADVKKCKKTLNILEIAATDKENLSSKIHRKKMNTNNPKSIFTKKNKKDVELDNKKVTDIKNKINKKNESTQSSNTVASDLTVDNPSEGYWKNLAESCRKALDTALKENVDLHNKVNELEYENSRLKVMLEEARSLVEVLTEMIEGNTDETVNTTKDESTLDETKGGATSESESEDMSFQSCI